MQAEVNDYRQPWLGLIIGYLYHLFKSLSASSFETFEVKGSEHSFLTKALLQALDCPGGKRLYSDLYKNINEC